MNEKHICMGLLAHVDAGKTTLSEALLYESGAIRQLGRVDHRDAFLDTDELERERGITIFSSQACFHWKNLSVTLLDTPGHVDFSAEMERTLGVLDYAVLVISGTDGVQGHTETLWRLLENYQIPTFLFVNKMDREGTDRRKITEELNRRLSAGCVDFRRPDGDGAFLEEIALTDERVLDAFLDTGKVENEEILRLIRERKVFPCFFGSALRIEGIREFLDGLDRYASSPSYPESFGARIFKITRDSQGTRLTWMKILGGSLKVKTMLEGKGWQEKADQLRIYSGDRYETVEEVEAGRICAVTGLSVAFAGEGIGSTPSAGSPELLPVLRYQIVLSDGTDIYQAFLKLKQLEEEDPQLSIMWNRESGEIHAHVMGEVQIEILKRLIRDRLGMTVDFADGSIVYRETIRAAVEGVGHFEPLRHYAEVHLLLEPGEPGSGLVFGSDCSEDVLALNWQRLILTHLAEKPHRGVLTGSEITDMKITLLSGRAHIKHTEGGDFRQATYRAVRHGLMRAESVLLEPIYAYELCVPKESLGRAMSDIQRMGGSFEDPRTEGDFAVLTGSAPVAGMRGYSTEVAAYGRGRGRLSLHFSGYEPCHNAQEIIAERGYDPERDEENPAGSVFCEHGAGYYVPWQQVEEHMHLPWSELVRAGKTNETITSSDKPAEKGNSRGFGVDEKELEEIFRRTYGERKQERRIPSRVLGDEPVQVRAGTMAAAVNSVNQEGEAAEAYRYRTRTGKPGKAEEYLLVDGYNIIFAWDELSELAQENLDGARGRLMDILSNYQGMRGGTLILVFDAYRVEGGQGSVSKYHNIYVVFTKEAETADQYIEKTVHAMAGKAKVTVATSDGLEQVIILGQGAVRMSARGLKDEISAASKELREVFPESAKGSLKGGLFDGITYEMVKKYIDTYIETK